MKARVAYLLTATLTATLAGCADDDAPRPAKVPATALRGQVVGPADAGFPAGTDVIGPLPAAAAPVPVTGALVRVAADGRALAEDFTLSGGQFRLSVDADGEALVYARIAAVDGQPWAGLDGARLTAGRETPLSAPLPLTAAAVAWGELGEPADLVVAPDLGRAVRPLADGSWVLGELPAGKLRLWALRDGAAPAELTAEFFAGRALQVTFPAFGAADVGAAEIGGQVVDDLSGIAVVGALVEAAGRVALSGADGRWRMRVDGGALVVRAAADGFLSSARAVGVADGQSRTVDIGLPRSRHFGQMGLVGRVTAGESGLPVTGAAVVVVGSETRAVVGVDGEFSLGAAAGCVALRATADGWGSAARVVCGPPGRTTVVGQLALPAAGLRCVADRELCGDERDNNCDGRIDEGCDRTPPEPVLLSRVVLTMAPPGQSDTLVGLPGAAEPSARLVATAFDAVRRELARVEIADDGSFPLIDLGDNAVENLQLVVVDAAGNASPPVVLVNDVRRPRAVILTGPASIERTGDATFTFGSDEPVTTTVCSHNDGPWQVCGSPWTLTGLTHGPQSFAIRSTDVAGNGGRQEWGEGDLWSWTVEPMLSTVSLGSAAVAAPVLVPDGRGGADLVVVRGGDGRVERRRGADRGATTLWSVLPPADAASEDPPLIVDLDGDGQLDVLVASATRAGYVGLRGSDGAEAVGGPWPVTTVNMWITESTERPRAALVSARFAADAVTSWIGLARKGAGDPRMVHRYRADLTSPVAVSLVWSAAGSELNGDPAVLDVDGDGHADVLLVDAEMVRAFRGSDLSALWVTGPVGNTNAQRVAPVVLSPAGATAPVVLVRFGERRLVALAGDDGRVLWDETLGSDGTLSPGFAVGDLDGDGQFELAAVVGGRLIIRRIGLAGTAAVADTNLADHGIGGIARAPLLADVDGDGRSEVLLLELRSPGRLWAFGADGALRWRATLPAQVLYAPAVGDLDGDGLTEIALVTTDGRLVVVSAAGDASAAGALPWPEEGGTAVARTRSVDVGEPDDDPAGAAWLGVLDTRLAARRLAEDGPALDHVALAVGADGHVTVSLRDVPPAASLNLHVYEFLAGVPSLLGSDVSGGSGDKTLGWPRAAGDRLLVAVEILTGGGALPYALEITRAP